jgi:hypothetical protein
VLALAGWFAGLWIARHPLRAEIALIWASLRHRLRKSPPAALPEKQLTRLSA